MYTLDRLKEININCEQPITESVLSKVSEIAELRRELDYSKPQVGDMVEFLDIKDRLYKHAHIEVIEDGKMYICLSPYTPFVSMDKDKKRLRTSASGGSWTWIYEDDLIEKSSFSLTEKRFCSFFGSAGGSSAVKFDVMVRVWKYEEIRSPKESLYETFSEKRVNDILNEIKKTTPKDIYEALKIFRNAFVYDRAFSFSPMFEGDSHAYIDLFDRYDIYCYCDTENIWSIYDNNLDKNLFK